MSVAWRLAASILAAITLHAQSGTGTIQGTVRDPAGAIVPAAKVTALHTQTSITREAATNEAGFYIVPSARIGRYKITIEVPGMQVWQAGLDLQVGQTAVADAKLLLGSTATEITVVGDVTSLVTQESATLGQVVERTRIEQLPLNGRFFNTLVALTTPGVEGQRVFGLREAAMEYVQDGAALVNRDTGGLQSRPPGLDTIQEFKVETNNSSAKVNRPATVIASTKAGTNEFHGSAFETHRNAAIGVARRRQDFYDKPPQLVRNEFGVSIGGPVLLPKVYDGRNKTFFFFAWETYRNYAKSTRALTMPTAEIRNGDFSGLADSLGRRTTIYDPWTTGRDWSRTPYPNNRIPLDRMSPLARYLYSVTPLPTHPEVNPLVASNFFAAMPDLRHDSTSTGRFDHRFTERDQTFVRFTGGTRYSKYPGNDPSFPTLDNSTNFTNLPVRNISAVFSWTHTFSPTFFLESLVNYSYENFDVYGGEFFKNYADQLGLPNPFKEEGFPYINNTGFGMKYVQPDTRRNNRTWVAGLDLNFTKIAGKHELQFGGRLRNERMHVLPDQSGVSGTHTFNSCGTCLFDPASGSSYSSVPRTGHDSANLFLGLANNYGVVFSQKMYRFRDREFSGYLQDNWKLSQRLTLNLGFRYEFHPALHEHERLFTGFDMNTKTMVNGLPIEDLLRRGRTTPEIVSTFSRIGVKFTTPDQVGLPPGLIHNDALGFGPRAGFAYKLKPGARPLILRGGYSLFVYPPPLRNFNASTRSNPPFNANFSRSSTSAAQSPDGLPNYAMRSVPTVIAGLNSANVVDPRQPGGVNRGGFTINFFDPNQPLTRVHEWNFTLEKEVMESTVARIAYVGNHGFNLEQFQQFNQQANNYIWFTTTGQPLPTGEFSGVARRSFDQTTYGEIRRFQKTGWSNFNGLTFEIQRRYAKGFAYQFFYVLSNAFRVAGNGWRDDLIPDPSIFLAGSAPTDTAALNRFMNYKRDTTIPKHRVRWNWLADLPIGQGKFIGRNLKGWKNRVAGGWQIAGFGNIRSNYWSLPVTNWGTLGNVEIYGTKHPIEDCRSGTCIPGYLYWNGYIAANRINSRDAQGRPNGIMGVPDNYRPAHTPIIPIPKDGGNPADPLFPFYDSNTVFITLRNGTVQRVGMDTSLHPWRNQYVLGPSSFSLDASLFKTIPIRENWQLRLNVDFFNVLNNPGLPQPNESNGIISLQNSANGPRNLQLTLRLSW